MPDDKRQMPTNYNNYPIEHAHASPDRSAVNFIKREDIDTSMFGKIPEVERYVRINVTRNSRGFNTDATVSVKTTDDALVVEEELATLRDVAQRQIDAEIERQGGDSG